VILVVTFKLATHTRFWSVILFITITFLSLGFYVIYMWISNYALSDYVEGTAFIAWTSIETYFIVLFCICLILFIDGVVVFMDFRKGSYASKMREIVHQEQINNRLYYDEVSVTLTSGLTASENNDAPSN
jgi:signal transduction histidine kinase